VSERPKWDARGASDRGARRPPPDRPTALAFFSRSPRRRRRCCWCPWLSAGRLPPQRISFGRVRFALYSASPACAGCGRSLCLVSLSLSLSLVRLQTAPSSDVTKAAPSASDGRQAPPPPRPLTHSAASLLRAKTQQRDRVPQLHTQLRLSVGASSPVQKCRGSIPGPASTLRYSTGLWTLMQGFLTITYLYVSLFFLVFLFCSTVLASFST